MSQKNGFWSPELLCYFVAGGIAGATSRTVVSPLERLKIIQWVIMSLWNVFDNEPKL